MSAEFKKFRILANVFDVFSGKSDFDDSIEKLYIVDDHDNDVYYVTYFGNTQNGDYMVYVDDNAHVSFLHRGDKIPKRLGKLHFAVLTEDYRGTIKVHNEFRNDGFTSQSYEVYRLRKILKEHGIAY